MITDTDPTNGFDRAIAEGRVHNTADGRLVVEPATDDATIARLEAQYTDATEAADQVDDGGNVKIDALVWALEAADELLDAYRAKVAP